MTKHIWAYVSVCLCVCHQCTYGLHVWYIIMRWTGIAALVYEMEIGIEKTGYNHRIIMLQEILNGTRTLTYYQGVDCIDWWFAHNYDMMTSWNGNVFSVTGLLCGEFAGHWWIPLTKASDAELWSFLWSTLWINGSVNNRESGDLRRLRAHYDVIVMSCQLPFNFRNDITKQRTQNHKQFPPLAYVNPITTILPTYLTHYKLNNGAQKH